MKLEDIESEWSKDVKIDRTSLDSESLRIPELHNKYYKMYIREKIEFKKADGEFAEFYKLKVEYFQGKLDRATLQEYNWDQFQLTILKNDLPLYLDADKELQERKLKLALQQEKVLYLESIIKNINTRSFTIKNAIEFIKFTNGN